jgi:hypothetical protein
VSKKRAKKRKRDRRRHGELQLRFEVGVWSDAEWRQASAPVADELPDFDDGLYVVTVRAYPDGRPDLPGAVATVPVEGDACMMCLLDDLALALARESGEHGLPFELRGPGPPHGLSVLGVWLRRTKGLAGWDDSVTANIGRDEWLESLGHS